MLTRVSRHRNTRRILVNGFKPVIDFGFNGSEQKGPGRLKTACGTLSFEENGTGILVRKELDQFEHVIGFGEKAFEIERRRLSLRMWNNDPGGYKRGDDPVYASIPFFICVRERVSGFFFNSVAELTFDVGVSEYDQIVARISEKGAEIYVFEGDSIEEVLEQYVQLTGKPFMPPGWSLGHQVSRFSYYPESTVIRLADEYTKIVPLSAIYLDIDYMDGFKLFTWNKRMFSDPGAMTAGLHKRGVKAVAIMDPGLKAEQGYRHFEEGMGGYIETKSKELYLGKVWPGLCAFPDFFTEKAVAHWKSMVRSFIRENGVDGLWLDMNEPSVFNKEKTIGAEAVQQVDGASVMHSDVHNAYALLEVKATYEAMKEVLDEPFILSRSGYAGIQRYAAVWTGDSTSSWDDLKLQISMVTSMGVSGIPLAGCDLGGFVGRTEPELLARYYQMAAFFPVYRNHKAKDGSDQELFQLPERYRRMAVDAVMMRYDFMPYIYSLAHEAHVTGHPIVRPLCYEFQNDHTAYSINDEYMVGRSLLYAPVIEKGATGREVYLPEGRWFCLTDGEELEGPAWHRKEGQMLTYVRHGAVIPLSNDRYMVYGQGRFSMYDGKVRLLSSKGKSFDAGSTIAKGEVTFLGARAKGCKVDGKKGQTSTEWLGTTVRASQFRKIELA